MIRYHTHQLHRHNTVGFPLVAPKPQDLGHFCFPLVKVYCQKINIFISVNFQTLKIFSEHQVARLWKFCNNLQLKYMIHFNPLKTSGNVSARVASNFCFLNQSICHLAVLPMLLSIELKVVFKKKNKTPPVKQFLSVCISYYRLCTSNI